MNVCDKELVKISIC